jgi:L-fuculose-phosphate aldolase
MYLAEFRSAGLALAKSGLNQGSSGNLSLRLGDKLIITRTGSDLAALNEGDLIETGLSQDDAQTPSASSELAVHRAIYLATEAQAVVHSHAPNVVALSLADCAVEGVKLVGESGPVVPGAFAEEIAAALKESPIAVVRGHGPFATGANLKAACHRMLAFEQACQRLCQAQGLKAQPGAGE